MKVKNLLKLNVDEQKDSKKHLNEYCDIDDIDPHEKKRLCVQHVMNHLYEIGWINILGKIH